jgi:hypothetical protein
MPATVPSADLPASAPKVTVLDPAILDVQGRGNAQSRVDQLLAWHLRRPETPGQQRSPELALAAVKDLIELLDRPSDEFMVAVLATESGRSALAAAFKELVPTIWRAAKRSRDPQNYSGAFPGPLMAMMRDRLYAGFLNRWRELCSVWGLDEASLIRTHQHAPASARPVTPSPRHPGSQELCGARRGQRRSTLQPGGCCRPGFGPPMSPMGHRRGGNMKPRCRFLLGKLPTARKSTGPAAC